MSGPEVAYLHTGPALIDGHQFGHHPDDRDPWDALYLDAKWAGADGTVLALITFWKGDARKRQAAADPIPAPITQERLAVALHDVAVSRLGACGISNRGAEHDAIHATQADALMAALGLTT